MALIPSLQVSASGLQAQKINMDITSSNLANVQTTRGPDGKAYRRISPIFKAVPLEFNTALKEELNVDLYEVKLSGIQTDQSPLKQVYDPGHPDANEKGFVEMPNVNLVEEMANMLLANRAYEANISAFNSSKTMALKLLDLGKV